MRRATFVPPVMTDPSLLRKYERWWRVCPDCGMRLQGGQAGLDAHLLVVHDATGP